jgi:choline transport protein
MIGPDSLQWRPWKAPSVLGEANNLFACIYLIVLWFFSFWPGSVGANAKSSNFSSVTFSGTVLFAVVWYLIRGRESYSGPVLEVDL